MKTGNQDITLRTEVRLSDLDAVREIIGSSGFFRDDETEVAVELVKERLDKGRESGYHFIFADMEAKTVAYACYGLIPCTLTSYDLYWIATHKDFRNTGLGSHLLAEVERSVSSLGGRGIYIETSNQPKYEPTRTFYLKNHYLEKARFEDFYAEGDDKVVYVKKL